jgi:hypothetical protein
MAGDVVNRRAPMRIERRDDRPLSDVGAESGRVEARHPCSCGDDLCDHLARDEPAIRGREDEIDLGPRVLVGTRPPLTGSGPLATLTLEAASERVHDTRSQRMHTGRT